MLIVASRFRNGWTLVGRQVGRALAESMSHRRTVPHGVENRPTDDEPPPDADHKQAAMHWRLPPWLVALAFLCGGMLALPVLSSLPAHSPEPYGTGQPELPRKQGNRASALDERQEPSNRDLDPPLLTESGVTLSDLRWQVVVVHSEEPIELSDSWLTRQGRPIVLNFWGTWCKPCLDEMEILRKISAKYYESVIFAGIAYELDLRDPTQRVRELLQKNGIGYANYIVDNQSLIQAIFQDQEIGYPAFALFDSAGILRYRSEGSLRDGDTLELLESAIVKVATPRPLSRSAVAEEGVLPKIQSENPTDLIGNSVGTTPQPQANVVLSLSNCLSNRKEYAADERAAAALLIANIDPATHEYFSSLTKPIGLSSIALLYPLALDYARNDYSGGEFNRMLSSLRNFAAQATEEPARGDMETGYHKDVKAYLDPGCSICGEVLRMLQGIEETCMTDIPIEVLLVQDQPVSREVAMLESLRNMRINIGERSTIGYGIRCIWLRCGLLPQGMRRMNRVGFGKRDMKMKLAGWRDEWERLKMQRRGLARMSALGQVVVLGLVVISSGGGSQASEACPEGMAWTGNKCAWRNLCEDGRPVRPGQRADVVCGERREAERVREIEIGPQGDGSVDLDLSPCNSQVIFNENAVRGKGRSVLFAGGSMESLFPLYLSRAKDGEIDIDLARLTVSFMDRRSRRLVVVVGDADVKLTYGERLAGKRFDLKWSEALKGRFALPIKEALKTAERERVDLVCGRS